MFERIFKSLDDIMFQEPGCNSELDYAEQSSWMLFQLPDYLKLKYGTLAEGGAALGGMQQVIDAYIGFQKQLYSPGN